MRAYGPDQKEGEQSTPSTQEPLNAQVLADLQFIAHAQPADLRPTEIRGTWDQIGQVFGPAFRCKMVGDVDLGWQCGEARGVLDVNGHTLNWSTGGGNGTGVDVTLIGSGRINWDGGSSGGWVTYPSNIRGNKPNTFTGVFRLRHGTMVLRKSPGIKALGGDVEIGGTDGLNEAFLVWGQSEQLVETSSITTLPLAKGVKNPRASLVLQGNVQTCGSLTIQTDTIIDLGESKEKNAGIFFADSSAKPWDLTKTLTIKGQGTVRFGNSAAGLTPAQLAVVRIETPQGKLRATIKADGTLVPAE